MRTLTENEVIKVLPVEDELLGDALVQFECSAPVLCRKPGYIKTLIAEGWMKTAQINFNNRPVYVIGWHLTTDGGLWVDIVQSLCSGISMEILYSGIEHLARAQNAVYVRWITMRKGLVRFVRSKGYVAEAVLLTKIL